MKTKKDEEILTTDTFLKQKTWEKQINEKMKSLIDENIHVLRQNYEEEWEKVKVKDKKKKKSKKIELEDEEEKTDKKVK